MFSFSTYSIANSLFLSSLIHQCFAKPASTVIGYSESSVPMVGGWSLFPFSLILTILSIQSYYGVDVLAQKIYGAPYKPYGTGGTMLVLMYLDSLRNGTKVEILFCRCQCKSIIKAFIEMVLIGKSLF